MVRSVVALRFFPWSGALLCAGLVLPSAALAGQRAVLELRGAVPPAALVNVAFEGAAVVPSPQAALDDRDLVAVVGAGNSPFQLLLKVAGAGPNLTFGGHALEFRDGIALLTAVQASAGALTHVGTLTMHGGADTARGALTLVVRAP